MVLILSPKKPSFLIVSYMPKKYQHCMNLYQRFCYEITSNYHLTDCSTWELPRERKCLLVIMYLVKNRRSTCSSLFDKDEREQGRK